MSVAPADKGHSPFPSPERAFYGFAGYLSSYIFSSMLAKCLVRVYYISVVCSELE